MVNQFIITLKLCAIILINNYYFRWVKNLLSNPIFACDYFYSGNWLEITKSNFSKNISIKVSSKKVIKWKF